jgi:type IV pilus assembly protein PilB
MSIAQQDLTSALLEKGFMSEEQIQRALKHAETQVLPLIDVIFKEQLIPSNKFAPFIAELYGVPVADLTERSIPEAMLSVVPYKMAITQHLIAFDEDDEGISIATSDPHNFELINSLGNKMGKKIKVHYSPQAVVQIALKAYNKDINKKFDKLLKKALADPNNIESLQETSKIVDNIILFAFQNHASDIHLEPQKEYLAVRYRIDGILHAISELPIQLADLITTRIKVLAKMRTDEHRAAQDGRFKIILERNEITLRVSIVPIYAGEKTVMRILSASNQELKLSSLGYTEHSLAIIEKNIRKTNGIILMTGPTGSGKTTTLYTILKKLNTSEVNLSTIEDPIEYQLDGINQIQVNTKSDLTFSNGLRALLRQDPDIIMVGEIRDEETGGIGINAALTGHLVFATLHTNDAVSTLPRLSEMNIEAFLIAATVRMVIAQRLARKICSKCKKERSITKEQIHVLIEKYDIKEDLLALIARLGGQDPNGPFNFYEAEGCNMCNETGYKGRVAVNEILEISDAIKNAILNGKNSEELRVIAKGEGMVDMFEDGLLKSIKGETTIEEVLRVMHS